MSGLCDNRPLGTDLYKPPPALLVRSTVRMKEMVFVTILCPCLVFVSVKVLCLFAMMLCPFLSVLCRVMIVARPFLDVLRFSVTILCPFFVTILCPFVVVCVSMLVLCLFVGVSCLVIIVL